MRGGFNSNPNSSPVPIRNFPRSGGLPPAPCDPCRGSCFTAKGPCERTAQATTQTMEFPSYFPSFPRHGGVVICIQKKGRRLEQVFSVHSNPLLPDRGGISSPAALWKPSPRVFITPVPSSTSVSQKGSTEDQWRGRAGSLQPAAFFESVGPSVGLLGSTSGPVPPELPMPMQYTFAIRNQSRSVCYGIPAHVFHSKKNP